MQTNYLNGDPGRFRYAARIYPAGCAARPFDGSKTTYDLSKAASYVEVAITAAEMKAASRNAEDARCGAGHWLRA